MIYLLDTNVLAELGRRAPDARVTSWFRTTPRPSRYLSVITLAEIDAGIRRAPDGLRRARYAQMLAEIRQD